MPGVEADDAWRTKLQQVVEERDRYLRERDVAQRELDTNRRTLAELSLRLIVWRQNRALMARPERPLN